MKKIAILIIISFCTLSFIPNAKANTVSIILSGTENVEISGFQLFFIEPDGSYGWPVEFDNNVIPPTCDFSYDWGNAVPYSGDYWGLDTYIDGIDDDVDHVRGILLYADSFVSWNKLDDGIVLTMTSENTIFGINISDSKKQFYDFQGDFGKIIPPELLNFDEIWLSGDQTVIISAVPIPGGLILLGSGLIGLIGLGRRRIKKFSL